MYCLKCGKEINDSLPFCRYCGCVTENAKIDNSVSLQKNNKQMILDLMPKITLPLVASVCGIYAIVLACCIPFTSLFTAIVAFVLSGIALCISLTERRKNPNPTNPIDTRIKKVLKIAHISSIIAIGISIISSIIRIVITLI